MKLQCPLVGVRPTLRWELLSRRVERGGCSTSQACPGEVERRVKASSWWVVVSCATVVAVIVLAGWSRRLAPRRQRQRS